jgi:uncharacterized membrane protein YoaK (UPF0700 family)
VFFEFISILLLSVLMHFIISFSDKKKFSIFLNLICIFGIGLIFKSVEKVISSESVSVGSTVYRALNGIFPVTSTTF